MKDKNFGSLNLFCLVHLGTVYAIYCCEQNPSKKQLKKRVGFGDSWRDTVHHGQEGLGGWWFQGGRSGEWNLFTFLHLCGAEIEAGAVRGAGV